MSKNSAFYISATVWVIILISGTAIRVWLKIPNDFSQSNIISFLLTSVAAFIVAKLTYWMLTK